MSEPEPRCPYCGGDLSPPVEADVWSGDPPLSWPRACVDCDAQVWANVE